MPARSLESEAPRSDLGLGAYPLGVWRDQIRKQQFSSRIGRERLGGGRSHAMESGRPADGAGCDGEEKLP